MLDSKVVILRRKYVFSPGAEYAIYRHDRTGVFSFVEHAHDSYVDFLLVLAGDLRQRIAGKQALLRGPELMLIRERDVHELAGDEVRFWNLNIRTGEWKRLRALLGSELNMDQLQAAPTPPKVRLSAEEALHLDREMRLLFARQGGTGNRWVLHRTCIDLLALLAGQAGKVRSVLYASPVGSTPVKRTREMPAWFIDLLRWAESDAGTAAGLAKLVSYSGRSHEHLTRCFRRYLACTPVSWVNRRRVEQAALLLERTDRDILSISLSLGFQSTAHFYRLFKAAHGVSPAAWRASHRTH